MSNTTATVKKFRFTSGQIMIIDDDKIEKVPYLATLVSTADYFESVCDGNGYYLLDRNIKYEDFRFAIESTSFHSFRQLFNHLPKENDIISMIALLDFLGIGPQMSPSLREVDSTFFSNLVYSPFLSYYVQIVKPSIIQDMAVLFAFAIVKEDYDFKNTEVMNQIYWLVMFILSAYKMFGCRFRHHMYKVAENCFSIFERVKLRSLEKLRRRVERETNESILETKGRDMNPDEETKHPIEKLFDVEFNYSSFFEPSLLDRRDLIMDRPFTSGGSRSTWRYTLTRENILKPAYQRVLEIIYENLQGEVYRQLAIEMRSKKLEDILLTKYSLLLYFSLSYFNPPLPKRIYDLFEHESVNNEIHKYVSEEICNLLPKLEERRRKLTIQIQAFNSNEEQFGGTWPNYSAMFLISKFSRFESLQEEALAYELILEKLHQDSSIQEEIHRRVIEGLQSAAQTQFSHWMHTETTIRRLRRILSDDRPENSLLHSLFNKKPLTFPVIANKRLPTIQPKHSTCHRRKF